MNIYWKYFKQVILHKKYVFEECKACGITWQGIIHDFSKFNKEEFIPYAKYFMEDKEKNKDGFISAWMHHKGHNPHHWEYWIDYGKHGEIITNQIPYNYVVEMICDWIGAGKAYEKTEWELTSPLKYYNKVREGRHFHPVTEKLIFKFLYCIANHGLEEFHKLTKNSFLKEYYDEGNLP